MADVNSTQDLTATVERQEVLIARAWNLFKTVMVYLGGIATLAWLIWLGYSWGSSGCYTCTLNKPVAAVVTPLPVSSTQTSETATIAELAKDLSAIANIIAEQKAVTQASASAAASATTAVVVSPPPKVEQRAPAMKRQAEPPCPCPSPGKTQTLEQGPVPMPTLSSAEHRRNEIWSALRR